MTRIQVRRGTSAEWSSANPVLASGEPGYDTTLSKHKLGDGVTAWDSLPFSEAGGASRATATHTTASLDAAAGEDFTLSMSKSFAVLKVACDVGDARVRLYASSDYRTADTARAVGVDPTGDHGLIAEVVTTDAVTSIWLSPVAQGATVADDSTVYARIDNQDASAQAVELTVTYLPLEV